MNTVQIRRGEERREALLDVLQNNPDDKFYASDFDFSPFDEVTTETIVHDLYRLLGEHEKVQKRRVRGFTPQLEWYWNV